MKRLLLTIPLLLSTMAIGPCAPVDIGTLDGGGVSHPDGGPDHVDANPDGMVVPDAASGGGPATGGASAAGSGGSQTGGMARGGAGGAATGGGGGSAGANTGGTGGPAGRLSCTPSTTWQASDVFSATTMGGSEGMMISDAAGGLHAVARLIAATSGIVSTFRPPGGTWTLPMFVQLTGSSMPRVASDASFRDHVIWHGSGNGDRVNYAVSSAAGPWAIERGIDTPSLFMTGHSLVIDANGNPQVFALQFGAGGAFLRKNGTAWVQQSVPDATGANFWAMTTDGTRVLLVYRNTAMARLESVLVGVDGSLGTPEPIATASGGRGSVVTLPDGTFYLLYSDATGLHSAAKVGAAAWTAGTAPVPGTALMCATTDRCLAVDGRGRLHTLVADASASPIVTQYAHTDASGQWQLEPLDLGQTPSIFSLDVDPAGTVHIFGYVPGATANSAIFRLYSRCPAADAGALPGPVPATAGTWQQQTSPTRPGDRFRAQGMVFDSSQHEMVMFGGATLSGTGPTFTAAPETWTYPTSGSGWVRKAVAAGTNPGARDNQGMAFDAARARVVLMGGGFTTDVWEWDGAAATWTARPAAGSPPAGLVSSSLSDPGTRLAYDSARAKMVVLSSNAGVWGLWDWDPTTGVFTPRTTAGPMPSTVTSIAYDTASGLIIANGPGATWEWAPSTGGWTDRTGTAPRPPGGEIVAAGGGRFVVYDGSATWEWSRAAAIWRQRTLTQLGPPARSQPLVAQHPERGAVWMFGGAGNAPADGYLSPFPTGMSSLQGLSTNDTFEWHGAAAAP
jgi:hypothetical protein